jgi:hypothetical protein
VPARRKPDPEALLRELAVVGEYPATFEGAMDAYRDFRAVFVDDERGRRVLSQILAWGRIMGTTFDPDSHHMAMLNGQRELALLVLSTVEVEPAARPKAAVRPRTSRAAKPRE